MEKQGEEEAASLRGSQKKKGLRLPAGRNICLPQLMGGVGMACLLKGQDRSLQMDL